VPLNAIARRERREFEGERIDVGLVGEVLACEDRCGEARKWTSFRFVPIQLEGSSDAVPESGLQADERRALEDSIAEYQDTIAALRQDNASNQEVIGQLGLLGVALQALKRHDEAISVLRGR